MRGAAVVDICLNNETNKETPHLNERRGKSEKAD